VHALICYRDAAIGGRGDRLLLQNGQRALKALQQRVFQRRPLEKVSGLLSDVTDRKRAGPTASRDIAASTSSRILRRKTSELKDWT
jgi:hypothetical protein